MNISGSAVDATQKVSDHILTESVRYKPKNKFGVFLPSIKQACLGSNMSRESVARGWLWHLLGNTLFADKSGNIVHTNILNLLADLDNEVPQMAWGAGTLAYLYLQLGMASRSGVHQISGCLTLLEVLLFNYCYLNLLFI